MKGVLVIVIIALIYTCALTNAVKRSELKAGAVTATLEEVLKANFSSFAARIQSQNPGLWSQIVNTTGTNDNYLTIFAPTNAAVTSNVTTTAQQLLYHVHSGDVGVTQIIQFTTLPTLFNEPALNNHSQVLAFTFTNSSTGKTVTINSNVNMVDADILATNGIVHSISALIALPSQTVGQRLGNDFPTLTALAKRVNQTLSANDITLLAPTELAFANLFAKNSLIPMYLLNTSTPATFANINSILGAHVVTQAFYPSTLNNGTNTFTTLAGGSIEINRTVNNSVSVITGDTVAANVVTPNMLAANGVVHSIDSVLVPSTFSITLLEGLQALGASSFINVVTAYNLGSLLNESSLYTIFVPTNAALSKNNVTSPEQALYHVAAVQNANFNNNLMPSLLTLPSLNGAAQQLFGSTNATTNATRYINGVAVQGPYTTTKGTYIYLIDTTLNAPAAALTSLTAANFNTFVALLEEKQLSGNKNIHPLDTNALTLFAPTDLAFSALPHGALGFLRLNATGDAEVPIATALINNHIVPGNLVYKFNDPNISLVTANGNARLDIVTVGKNAVSTIYNGQQRITIADVPVLLENGVAHPINEVILPANVGFNAINLLEGLGLENASTWGSYTQFVDACKVSGLIHHLEDDTASFTIFPPNDDAWAKASETFDFANIHQNDTEKIIRIQEILSYHIVYGDDIETLNKTNVFRVGNTNNTLEVSDENQVTLFFAGDTSPQGTANIKVDTTTTYGQRIYGIDRVLGVGVENPKKSGLTTLEWILIGVGGAVLGLIILLIVAGAAYYLLVRPKSGYRKIN